MLDRIQDVQVAAGNPGNAEAAGATTRRARLIGVWAAGLALATGLVWLLSPLLIDSQPPLEWDAAAGAYVPAAGQQYHTRREGSADSLIGNHGVAAIADANQVKRPKVIFWGDSYVEGLQVPDDQKLAQQFNQLERDWFGVAVAMSGRSLADHCQLIGNYERLIDDVRCHVIVIGGVEDVCPDKPGRQYTFVSQPTFAIQPTGWTPTHQDIKDITSRYRLGFMWDAYRQLATAPLRFQLGPIQPAEQPDLASRLTPQAAKFLASTLRKRTDKRLVIVYAPHVPFIRDNAVCFDDPDAAAMRIFAAACAANGIEFVNLAGTFNDYHRETGLFPRGFDNSHPWLGHLNAAGHRLAAETIYQHLRRAAHAVPSD